MKTPHYWKVGDLMKQNDELPRLVIYTDADAISTYLGTISADGEIKEFRDFVGDDHFSHSTGLQYDFRSKESAQKDYQNGLFTPYFEIL